MEAPKSFETLKDVLLAAAREPDLPSFLETLVQGTVADRPHVTYTAVWLTEGSDRKRLRLTSSAWKAGEGETEPRRDPIPELDIVTPEEPIIGKVLRDGEAGMALNESAWPGGALPEWARREGLLTYLVEPISSDGEFLGAIAVFGTVCQTVGGLKGTTLQPQKVECFTAAGGADVTH